MVWAVMIEPFWDVTGGDPLQLALASAYPVADLLARVGGEEFVLVCPDTPPAVGVQAVERPRALVPEAQTCSAGIT